MSTPKRALSKASKVFIKELGGALQAKMAICYEADELNLRHAEDCGPGELYAKEHLLYEEKTALGAARVWFDVEEFCALVDNDYAIQHLLDVFDYLNNADIGLRQAMNESVGYAFDQEEGEYSLCLLESEIRGLQAGGVQPSV